MKRILSIYINIIMILLLASCGKSEGKIDTGSTEPVSSTYPRSEEITVEKEEEETTEWINPYAENYRVITKQHIDEAWLGDWQTIHLPHVISRIRNSNVDDGEACIAIVTLIKVGEDDGEYHGHTPVYFKIEKVLDHNGRGETLTEGAKVESFDSAEWFLCDDGTYEITVAPSFLPIAEVGSRYIVYMEYYNGRWVKHNLTRPFRSDGCYVDTVAIGVEDYEYISAETLWYYDVNSEYYIDYWEKNQDMLKYYKDNNIDVFDKSFVDG